MSKKFVYQVGNNKKVTINSVTKVPLEQRHTRINIYRTLARHTFAYGCERWTVRNNEENRSVAAEMRFMGRGAGCTRWGHKFS